MLLLSSSILMLYIASGVGFEGPVLQHTCMQVNSKRRQHWDHKTCHKASHWVGLIYNELISIRSNTTCNVHVHIFFSWFNFSNSTSETPTNMIYIETSMQCIDICTIFSDNAGHCLKCRCWLKKQNTAIMKKTFLLVYIHT